MGTNYKTVQNGNGTELIINDNSYIKVGKDGGDVWIRFNGALVCFVSLSDLINAIDISKASFTLNDNQAEAHNNELACAIYQAYLEGGEDGIDRFFTEDAYNQSGDKLTRDESVAINKKFHDEGMANFNIENYASLENDSDLSLD